MAETVTIDKEYFDTLLRRAEFYASENHVLNHQRLPLPTVSILRTEHELLLRREQEYEKLRAALFRGGLDQQTLQILIDGAVPATEASTTVTEDDSEAGVTLLASYGRRSRPLDGPIPSVNVESVKATPFDSPDSHPTAKFPRKIGREFSTEVFEVASALSADASSQAGQGNAENEGPRIEKGISRTMDDQRSVLLCNLSNRTTYKDIVSVIRGGALLDVFLRLTDRSASVSFVTSNAAQAFMASARRQDIYIHGKRVELRWSDRQYIQPNHVAWKIANGATRNLVIRNPGNKVTEHSLREDLEHIHNLYVIEVIFKDQNVYVSTNSVHNALYARTCMMSRATYKGTRIEWYPDECAQPLPVIRRAAGLENISPPKRLEKPTMNRFQLLGLDGNEESTDDEID